MKDTSKTKHVTDLILMNKAIAKVNQYENFSTQLTLYLKTFWHSLTTQFLSHINDLHLGSDYLCRGTALTLLKKIYAVLRNHKTDHKASSIYFNGELCTDSSVTDQEQYF